MSTDSVMVKEFINGEASPATEDIQVINDPTGAVEALDKLVTSCAAMADLLGKHQGEYVHPDDAEVLRHHFEKAEAGIKRAIGMLEDYFSVCEDCDLSMYAVVGIEHDVIAARAQEYFREHPAPADPEDRDAWSSYCSDAFDRSCIQEDIDGALDDLLSDAYGHFELTLAECVSEQE